MDVTLWVVLIANVITTGIAVPLLQNLQDVVPKSLDNAFVPGVFIPADALKSFQEKSLQNNPQNNPPEASNDVEKKSEQTAISPNINEQKLLLQNDLQQSTQTKLMLDPNQQSGNPSQNLNQPPLQSSYSNQQPSYVNQPTVNSDPGFTLQQSGLQSQQAITPNANIEPQPSPQPIGYQAPNVYVQQPAGNNQPPNSYLSQPLVNNPQPVQPVMAYNHPEYNQQSMGINPQLKPNSYNQLPDLNNQQGNGYGQQPMAINQQVNGKSPQFIANNQPENGYILQSAANNKQSNPYNQPTAANNQQFIGYMQQPVLNNHQPNEYNQQPVSSQPSGYVQQPLNNNKQPNGYYQQSILNNQQPGGISQKLIDNHQPNSNQQLSNHNQQAIGYNQQPNGYSQQPNGYNQQPIGNNQQQNGYNQPNGYNQQIKEYNPQLGNPQAILVAQPSQSLFIPNVQPGQPTVVPQPNAMVANNPNGAFIGNSNPSSNQGNLYAVVPVNGQNSMPNPNLSNNNNAYFVPVQPVSTNAVLIVPA